MKAVLGMLAIFPCYWGSLLQSRAQANETHAATALIQLDQRFVQAAPYSDATNITKHFGYTVPLPDYSITNESFQTKVPEALSTNESWGLLVWISPNDAPAIPSDWDRQLEKHHLLFVSPRRGGNFRHPLDRFRLALDATCNMCRRYTVDRRRIYIGGFSGGARIASMLGVAYADIYTGTLCVCGVNFYKDVQGEGAQYYPATFTPNPAVLPLAKRGGRFVLLTGQHDENRANTERISTHGFKREGFRNVHYIEVPGLSHEMPSAVVIDGALDYLAGIAATQ